MQASTPKTKRARKHKSKREMKKCKKASNQQRERYIKHNETGKHTSKRQRDREKEKDNAGYVKKRSKQATRKNVRPNQAHRVKEVDTSQQANIHQCIAALHRQQESQKATRRGTVKESQTAIRRGRVSEPQKAVRPGTVRPRGTIKRHQPRKPRSTIKRHQAMPSNHQRDSTSSCEAVISSKGEVGERYSRPILLLGSPM